MAVRVSPQAQERTATSARAHERSAQSLLNQKRWNKAFVESSRALQLDPMSLKACRLAVAGLIGDGRRQAALRLLRRLLHRFPSDAEARLQVAYILLRMGEWDRALNEVRRAMELNTDDIRPQTLEATINLWAGRLRLASPLARRIRRLVPASSDGFRLLGAIKLLQDDDAGAMRELDRAIALNPADVEAYAWRGEARRKLRRYSEALKDLDLSARIYPSNLGAAVNRALVLMSLRKPWRKDFESILRASPIVEKSSTILARHRRSPDELYRPVAERLLKSLLGTLRGNRSPFPTYVSQGKRNTLRIYTQKVDARYLALEAQQVLLRDGINGALSAFGKLLRSCPEEPLFYTYRGELKMWIGDYRGARRDFERAINIREQTLWAYVGLAGLEVLNNDFSAAFSLLGRHRRWYRSPASTMHVWRGEARRKSGAVQAALRDLRIAVRKHPQRISAWINLALAEGQEGSQVGQAKIFKRLAVEARDLIDCARQELGLTPGLDTRAVSCQEVQQILERTLEMMRGNRSSALMTYFTRSGEMRSVDRLWWWHPVAGAP